MITNYNEHWDNYDDIGVQHLLCIKEISSTLQLIGTLQPVINRVFIMSSAIFIYLSFTQFSTGFIIIRTTKL